VVEKSLLSMDVLTLARLAAERALIWLSSASSRYL